MIGGRSSVDQICLEYFKPPWNPYNAGQGRPTPYIQDQSKTFKHVSGSTIFFSKFEVNKSPETNKWHQIFNI